MTNFKAILKGGRTCQFEDRLIIKQSLSVGRDLSWSVLATAQLQWTVAVLIINIKIAYQSFWLPAIWLTKEYDRVSFPRSCSGRARGVRFKSRLHFVAFGQQGEGKRGTIMWKKWVCNCSTIYHCIITILIVKRVYYINENRHVIFHSFVSTLMGSLVFNRSLLREMSQLMDIVDTWLLF